MSREKVDLLMQEKYPIEPMKREDLREVFFFFFLSIFFFK